jgi:hypothetical protein
MFGEIERRSVVEILIKDEIAKADPLMGNCELD